VSGVVAVILAADAPPRRLGRPRQLAPYQGTTLLRGLAIEAVRSSCDRVGVVVGAAAGLVVPTLHGLDVELAPSPQWREGLGPSIRAGLEWAARTGATAAILCACDRPGLDAVHLDRMIGAYHASGGVVASQDGDRLGLPALFPRAAFERLGEVSGDLGLRRLIEGLAPAIVAWPDDVTASARRTA
jgi:molybdenum cofactor cytidylyltransferase